jgi:hypothetical protein
MSLKQIILDRVEASKNYMENKRIVFDTLEKLATGQLSDLISSGTTSRVFDPKLATMTIERSNRVMAQLPTGKIRAISKNDEGTEKLMNLILEKYVLPNASAQWEFLTKCRMVDLYSNIYGSLDVFVDWDIKANGYVGPDMWILNVRDVFEQVGAVSLEDSDYVIIRTWKPLSFFENLRGQPGYRNIDKIIKKLKDKAGSKDARTSDEKSKREENEYPNGQAAKKDGFYAIYSQYERDRWIDYVQDADEIFRDIKNPQENGELPVIRKYSMPLLDDIKGLGDFERGYTMNMALNAVWNLSLDSAKMSLKPITMLNKDAIADSSSIKMTPGAKWLGRGNINNFAQTLGVSPQNINTFQTLFQVLNASMLNAFGTSDTSVTAATDPGMGKTPEALKMQGARENTRDNADRFYMEQFLKKVYNRFTNLISKKQTGAVQVRLFKEEIEDLVKSYPEMEEMYDQKTGKITIPKKKFGSVLFDYEMVSGSTYAKDQKEQRDLILFYLDMFIKSPQLIQYLAEKEGKEVKLGELITRGFVNSGIQDWDKVIVDMNKGGDNGEELQANLDQGQQQVMQAIQQIQGMNQIPPQQGGMEGQPMPQGNMPGGMQ